MSDEATQWQARCMEARAERDRYARLYHAMRHLKAYWKAQTDLARADVTDLEAALIADVRLDPALVPITQDNPPILRCPSCRRGLQHRAGTASDVWTCLGCATPYQVALQVTPVPRQP